MPICKSCNPCCMSLQLGATILGSVLAVIYGFNIVNCFVAMGILVHLTAGLALIFGVIIFSIGYFCAFILEIIGARKKHYGFCRLSFWGLLTFEIFWFLYAIVLWTYVGFYVHIAIIGVFVLWMLEIYNLVVLYAYCQELKQIPQETGPEGQVSAVYSTEVANPATPSNIAANQSQKTDAAAASET